MAGVFETSNEQFRRKFSLVVSYVIACCGAIVCIVGLIFDPHPLTSGPAALVTIAGVTALILHRYQRPTAASAVILVTTMSGPCISPIVASIMFHNEPSAVMPITVFTHAISVILAAFLLGPRASLCFAAVAIIFIALAHVPRTIAGTAPLAYYKLGMTGVLFIVMNAVIIFLFARQALRVADAHEQRLEHNKALFNQVPTSVEQLNAASGEIAAMSHQLKEGAVRQASAVDETRTSLRAIQSGSDDIVTASETTVNNAGTTLTQAEALADDIRIMSGHAQGIGEFSSTIKELASKADLLALNAALEGTKAGDAGRGFSLVASQMQTLSEHIGGAANQIARLTGDISQTTTSSKLSTEEATRLALATNEAAVQINRISRQQRSSVEQVATAVDDVAAISTEVVSGTKETIASTEALEGLAQDLSQMVTDFRSASTGDDEDS